MRTKNSTLILLLLFLPFIGCKENSKPQKINVQPEKPSLQALPKEMMDKMMNEVDYIDYLWHDLPFSLSQEEKEGINANIMFISDEAVPEIPSGCKSIGRKTYNIKGNTYLTADVYFSPSCNFYVFLDGEKPIYANKMTAQGVNFYTQVIQSQTGR